MEKVTNVRFLKTNSGKKGEGMPVVRNLQFYFKERFLGTTENAVRIQIYVVIITYCLVAIVHHDMKLDRTVYETLQILGISLTNKTHLRDLFDKTNLPN